jgi:hypothetical protein
MRDTTLVRIKAMKNIIEKYVKNGFISRFVVLDLLDKFQFFLAFIKEEEKTNPADNGITEVIEITEHIVLLLSIRRDEINYELWNVRDSKLEIQIFGLDESETASKFVYFKYNKHAS